VEVFYRQKLSALITSGFTAVTTTKTPSTHNVPTAKSVLPRHQLLPGAESCSAQSDTVWEAVGANRAPTALQKTKPTTEQSRCFPGAGPGHTASPHRPHSICLTTQAGTIPRGSPLNRPRCKVCLNHLLQGASSHLCCFLSWTAQSGDRPPAAGSSRRTGSHCRELLLLKN